jgi:hypothetical protein
MRDDIKQAEGAARLLKGAEIIAAPLPCLCGFVWVLRRSTASVNGHSRRLAGFAEYGKCRREPPGGRRRLGYARSGRDFADGLIAFEGQWLGGATFVSFDKKAVALLETQGRAARVPV